MGDGTHLDWPARDGQDPLDLGLHELAVVVVGAVLDQTDERRQHEHQHLLVHQLFADHREHRPVQNLLQVQAIGEESRRCVEVEYCYHRAPGIPRAKSETFMNFLGNYFFLFKNSHGSKHCDTSQNGCSSVSKFFTKEAYSQGFPEVKQLSRRDSGNRQGKTVASDFF